MKAICQPQRGCRCLPPPPPLLLGDGDMWTARPWPFKKLHVFATWCVNIKSGWCCYVKTRWSGAVLRRSQVNASLASFRLPNRDCSLKCFFFFFFLLRGAHGSGAVWSWKKKETERERKKKTGFSRSTQHESSSAPFSSFTCGKRTPDASLSRPVEVISPRSDRLPRGGGGFFSSSPQSTKR